MSSRTETFEARRARLVARATAEREELARRLAPLGSVDRGLERLRGMRPRLPVIAIGAGLGLAALLLAPFAGRSPLIRGGLTALRLAGSAMGLLARR